MNETATTESRDTIKPPVTSVGVIGWLRANLFNNILNTILTLVTLYILWQVVPAFIRWAFIDSHWYTTSEVCREADGACWAVIPANIRFILFGFFPYEMQWRPLLAMILLVSLLFYSRNRKHWKKSLLYAWIASLFIMGLLMRGGILGLAPVEPSQWGGLPLTLMLSVFGLTAAYQLGVILALGRQSRMPIVKNLCIVYIEMIREAVAGYVMPDCARFTEIVGASLGNAAGCLGAASLVFKNINTTH